MNEEQKRIKIAEEVGWKFHPPTEHLYSEQEKAEAIMCWVRPGNDPWQMERVPDYFNDLNAMHEAEKSLSDGQYTIFCDHLHDFACEEQLQTGKWRWLSSTAAQRAEAFGRTLNLW